MDSDRFSRFYYFHYKYSSMITRCFSRILFFVVIFLGFNETVAGQVNCLNLMDENNKVSSIHFLKSKSIPIILRSSHSYRLQLGNGVKGPYIKLFSLGADKLNKNDEVIFIDQNQRRQTFKFADENETINDRGVSIHSNTLYLSKEDMEWFCVNRIDVVFIRFNLLLTMRKFTLEKDRSAELRQLSDCFWKTIDKTMIIDSNVDTKVQASVSQQNQVKSNLPPPPPARSGAEANTFGADKELTDLKSELEATKKRVKQEIELELEKLEQVKRDLSDQVLLAQKQAANQKEAYANEVLDARKKAEAELNQIKLNNAIVVEQSKKNAETRLEEIAAEVASARLKAEQEVDRIKLESAQNIQEIRKESSEAIARLEKDMELTRLKYADEVAEAKSKSLVMIDDIRAQVKNYVDSLSSSRISFQEASAEDVRLVKESVGKQILDIQKESAAEIGRLMEQKVLMQEKLAIDVAQARKNAESEINNLSENLTLQKAKLEELLVRERERQYTEIEENRRRALEEIQKSNFIVEQLLAGNRKKTDSLLVAENSKVQLKLDSLKRVRAQIDNIVTGEIERSKSFQDSVRNEMTRLNKRTVERQNLIRSKMDSLSHAAKRREEMLNKEIKEKITERNSRLTRFKDSLARLEEADILALEMRKKERQEELAEELKSARIVSRQKMEDIEAELGKKISLINEEREKNKEILSSEFDDNIKKMREKLAEEEIAAAKRSAEIKRNLASEEELGQAKISERKNQVRQQLDSLNAFLAQEKTRRLQEYSLRKSNLDKALDSLQYRNELAYMNAKSLHDARMRTLDSIENVKTSESRQRISNAELSAAEKINKVIEFKQEEIDAMEKQFQQAILKIENTKGRIVREREEEISEINRLYNSKRDSLLSVHNAEIMRSYDEVAHLKDSLEMRMQELLASHNEQISEEKDKLSKDIYEARRLSIDQINEIKRRTLEERDQLEAEIEERELYLKELDSQILEKEKTLKKN